MSRRKIEGPMNEFCTRVSQSATPLVAVASHAGVEHLHRVFSNPCVNLSAGS
jgi:hypothetical protein